MGATLSNPGVTAERWTTTERGECLLCTAHDDRSKVDTGTDLEDGRRVFVCTECVTRLAKVQRVGSKATDAVRDELEAEIAERDQRLASLAGQLSEQERKLDEQGVQLESCRGGLNEASVWASQAVGLLQQIGKT